MLKSLKNFFLSILDTFLPERKDYSVVKKLGEDEINNLPKARLIPEMEWIHSLFDYKDNRVRALIWELKYKENSLPLEHIGKILYEEILAVISDILVFNGDAVFLLIPIPITLIRRDERGYNQSEYIAKSILPNDLPHNLIYAPQWLTKIKDTPSQSHSESREERMKNLKDSFEANDGIQAKYIILIDDVVTTGSTLLEARKTLLEAGARNIIAFTIAH